jgi:hypothetical protein
MKIQLSTDSGSLDALEEVGLTGSGGFSIPALEGTAECLSGEAPTGNQRYRSLVGGQASWALDRLALRSWRLHPI